jgi:hypothetical protein
MQEKKGLLFNMAWYYYIIILKKNLNEQTN